MLYILYLVGIALGWLFLYTLHEARAASLDPLVRERLEFGAKVSATQYLRACAELTRLPAATDEATAGFDAVLMPTAPMGPRTLRCPSILSTYIK